jgi:purine nucleosidase
VLVETTLAHPPGVITLVTLGPLTNVAVALGREPQIADRLGRIVVMGGTGDGVGNVSAVAEFNVWADPEAAAIVFACGAPITMVGWDISRTYAAFGPEDAATLRALGPLGAFSVDIQATLTRFALEETHLVGFDLPDPIAMAVALDDTVATRTEHLNVVVETRGEHTRGETVVDHLGIAKRPPNVHVVLEASRQRFLAVLHAALTP